MPTLYVENVPADLYTALKARAKSEGRSVSAEVITLLKEHVPTRAELARRQRAFEVMLDIRARGSRGAEPFQSTEEMIRADRRR